MSESHIGITWSISVWIFHSIRQTLTRMDSLGNKKKTCHESHIGIRMIISVWTIMKSFMAGMNKALHESLIRISQNGNIRTTTAWWHCFPPGT